MLQEYAARGLLHSLRRSEAGKGKSEFHFLWFRDREFCLHVDQRAARIRMDGMLRDVAPRSRMDRELRAWIRSRQDLQLPAHRRIDPRRASVALRNSSGQVSLSMSSLDHDWEYLTRRLVHLLNELYVDVLARAQYFDWLVESFELDPDDPRWP